jgi:DNA-binding NarL/FixJ family response regulator
MSVVALVGDLLDRSKIAAAVPNTRFATTPDELAGSDGEALTVVIDVKAHPDAVAAARRLAPAARIVAYGRHDDPEALEAAQAAGADVALARSRFFHDPAAAIRGDASA